jgi:hypothetical protein
VSAPAPKIDAVRLAMSAGDWNKAINLAAKFQRLGKHKKVIMRANEALLRPGFQRQLGRNPTALIEAGKAALNERFNK